MKQYGLAFDRLLAKPERLGKAATSEAERRRFPADLASAPASSKSPVGIWRSARFQIVSALPGSMANDW